MPNNSSRLTVLLFVATIGLAACGSGEKKAASQVAAKVDSDEITASQVEMALSSIPNVPASAVKEVKRDVLGKLIDRQLAVRQALDAKLDRTPEVLAQLEDAKSAILARAYMRKTASSIAQPTQEEIEKFYNDHPELFTKRRIYNLQEIQMAPKDGLAVQIQGEISKGSDMQAIAGWLNSKGIGFAPKAGEVRAEQVGLEILPKLNELQDGQTGVFEGPGALYVMHIVASHPAPVDLKTASDAIKQMLMEKRVNEAIAANIAALKAKAKIEYLGEFSANPPPAPVLPASPAAGALDVSKGISGIK